DFITATYWLAADGKCSLDLNGNTTGEISQTFKTRKGQKYRVTFAMAGNTEGPPEMRLRVHAAGKSSEFTFDNTKRTRKDMGAPRKPWDFTADADQTTLVFSSLIEGIAGPALDNVAVVAAEE